MERRRTALGRVLECLDEGGAGEILPHEYVVPRTKLLVDQGQRQPASMEP